MIQFKTRLDALVFKARFEIIHLHCVLHNSWLPSVTLCAHIIKVEQRFPKCAPRIWRDPRPIPRWSVDTFCKG